MSQGLHGSGMQGARCRWCRQNEQVCAYRQGCCDACTHWERFDAAGNELRTPPHGFAMPTGRVCGTEVGFQKHIGDATLPCPECRFAHRQHTVQRLVAS